MLTRRISDILYRHDPGKTGCNADEDMEDEYDRIAAGIAALPMLSLETLRDCLIESFGEDLLDEAAVRNSFEEIQALEDV